MCSNTSMAYLKVYHQILKAVDYPKLDSFDDEALRRLFQNRDDQDKQDILKWIVTQFDAELETYVLSEEKLRYLLHRTGLIDSKIVCADFMSGLLPHEEQLVIWKNILMVVYYQNKGELKSEQIPENKNLCKPENAPPKSQKINLLPPEYQKDFDEQTKGNYSEYIEKMKKKLLTREQPKIMPYSARDLGCDSDETTGLEDTIKKVLGLNTPSISNTNDSSSLDWEVLSQFCSNYGQLVKPHVGEVLDEARNQNVMKLNHFGEYLQEYAFLTKVLQSFKLFSSYQEIISDHVSS